MNIQVLDLFTAYNSAKMHRENHSTSQYHPASACIEWGQCESVCPQHLEIISLLKEAS